MRHARDEIKETLFRGKPRGHSDGLLCRHPFNVIGDTLVSQQHDKTRSDPINLVGASLAVEEVVMESTAQYWRPVWEALEQYWKPRRRAHERATPMSGTLHLAQAQSNRGAGGRKKDVPDTER